MSNSGNYAFEGFNLARDIVHQTAVEKGWWEPQVVLGYHDADRTQPNGQRVHVPRSLGELLALVHSEVSEALEEVRAGHAPDHLYVADGKPEGVPAELADVIIRVLDICGHYGIDIEHAMLLKAKYNDSRSYRHGGKTL